MESRPVDELVAERPKHSHALIEEFELAAVSLEGDARQNMLSVPGIHCGSCVSRIERTLSQIDGVDHVRANLTTKRVIIVWREIAVLERTLDALDRLGFAYHLYENDPENGNPELRRLVKAVSVAGFAAANIMMLSFAVWAGADAISRDWLHILSGLIAAPALIYSGRIFFLSAWQGLEKGHANMDLPIAVAILLTFSLSVFETWSGSAHAYFDAATMLVFFLLIGRTLDFMMRDKARTAVRGLANLSPRGATKLLPDGGSEYIAVNELISGDRIRLAAGERVPVDATVIAGASDIDVSLVTGESLPVSAQIDMKLYAGALNLTAPLELLVIAPANSSFLAEMMRLVEMAENGRGKVRRLVDKVSTYYSPLVHLAAFMTFIGWWLQTGDVHRAAVVGISVLIITCPCALGLAVPMVQVIAAGRLFAKGILIKDGSALERLPQVDTVIFDKTGTLTQGLPTVARIVENEKSALGIAAGLAACSDHPYARAIARGVAETADDIQFDNISEVPGFGMQAHIAGRVYRLGRPDWVGGSDTASGHTVLACDNRVLVRFWFDDPVRIEAKSVVERLRAMGMKLAILSGDQKDNVDSVAQPLGIHEALAGQTPAEKLEYLQNLHVNGAKSIMIGDGLNDAAALAAAHVSIAPATAADVNRRSADIVFLHGDLNAIPLVIELARKAAGLVNQNIGLAVAYNFVAVPIAILGHVTPAVAAICMSASSIIVVANSLRLRGSQRPKQSNQLSANLVEAA